MAESDQWSIDQKELDRIERLRDRTDEIELIISGLTTVALFTLPGWLFQALSSSYSHRSFASTQAFELLLVIVPGMFYALGACFAIHLIIRAYWAGLAGLHSIYPNGIRWNRIPSVGPITLENYKHRLPSLRRAITSADHVASTLFSVISMIALGMLWISICFALVIITCQTIATLLQADMELAVRWSLSVLVVVFVVPPALLWLLDAVLAARFQRLAAAPVFRGLVGALIRINGWIWPQRLILPVQLTLQTNTRPYLFSLMMTLGIFGILIFGFIRYEAWTEFSISEQFRYLDDAAVEQGIDSAHYEHLRGPRDRLRPVPTIHHFEQRSAFIRVFLPYFPQRDNPVLDRQCSVERDAVDCLRSLWRVQLSDRKIDALQLVATERRDLNQRGLTGVLPLTGLMPGMHQLEIVWNPSASVESAHTYTIPFLFTPDQELGAESPASPVVDE
ncbi:MAG: hypothetical protein AAGH65_07965 [Pseudomonadota bacterium]